MDLDSQYPDYLNFRQYVGNFSTHRNQPVYSITKTGDGPEGRPMPRVVTAADHFGPGYYPTDRDFPGRYRSEEIPVGFLTRSAKAPNYTMGHEDRAGAFHKSMTGCSPKGPVAPGPGQYHEGTGHRVGLRAQEDNAPKYTIPMNGKDSGRPLPRSRSAADHLAPGTYDLPNRFDEISRRKAAQMEKAAKRTRDHWAGAQYSHIFTRLKPGTKSSGLSKTSSAPGLAATH
mmetsp:Transcript_29729/g.75697  ORF Transcript_29729/g.75697 Transcript_29729/m.75697 type:complete len:229 (+) Transcript_29729:79-765(+)